MAYFESETSMDGINEVISIRGEKKLDVIALADRFRPLNIIKHEGTVIQGEDGEWFICFDLKGSAKLPPNSGYSVPE